MHDSPRKSLLFQVEAELVETGVAHIREPIKHAEHEEDRRIGPDCDSWIALLDFDQRWS